MRRLASLLMLLALVSVPPASAGAERAPPPAVRPMRVMSMNGCTDQLVLALLPSNRIASVTWLARDPEFSVMSRQAQHVGVNHGLAEEVVRDQPDIVIAGTFTTVASTGLLKQLGYPVIEVADAQSFDQIRAITRQVAHAVGEEARGEALIAHMDRKLAELARDPAPPIRVAAWDGAGFDAAKGSLYDAVLRAAGAINVADEAATTHYGAPDTEVLLVAAPSLLVQGAPAFHHPDLRDNVSHHPLLRRYWGTDRTLTIRQSDYLCGTPFLADAAIALRDQLHGAAAAVRTSLPFAPRAPR